MLSKYKKPVTFMVKYVVVLLLFQPVKNDNVRIKRKNKNRPNNRRSLSLEELE